jgi:hypothetical protein
VAWRSLRAVSPRHIRLALSLALGAMGAASRPAHADTPRDTPAAIEIDRDAAPAGRVGFGFEGGEPVDAWGASLAAGWRGWLDRGADPAGPRRVRQRHAGVATGAAAPDAVARRRARARP